MGLCPRHCNGSSNRLLPFHFKGSTTSREGKRNKVVPLLLETDQCLCPAVQASRQFISSNPHVKTWGVFSFMVIDSEGNIKFCHMLNKEQVRVGLINVWKLLKFFNKCHSVSVHSRLFLFMSTFRHFIWTTMLPRIHVELSYWSICMVSIQSGISPLQRPKNRQPRWGM